MIDWIIFDNNRAALLLSQKIIDWFTQITWYLPSNDNGM